MRIIAECNTIKSVWALVEDGEIIEKVTTTGFNPYFHTRREISHTIRLELPESFFKRRWEHVHIYGSGCTTQEKKKIVEASAIAQFKSPVTVESNLLGAARGLLNDKAGIACILSTGSNSCLYDGKEIVKQVRSLGFLLGDEGSGSALGKLFVSDCLKGLAPMEICEQFYEKYELTPDNIMDIVYGSAVTSIELAKLSKFLSEHLDNDYIYGLVYKELKRFFERNLLQYEYACYPLSFIGEEACLYSELLRKIASEFGMEIGEIEPSALEGLVKYHSKNEE